MRIFNNQSVLAFILLTVFANGFVSINILEKNKRYYTSLMKTITEENIKLTATLADLKSEGMAVIVTMYQPVRGQTDSTPNILADGTRIKTELASNYKFIAVSRNLLIRHGGWLDYGDFVLLKGTDGKDGVYQVRDTMNKRWVNRIDILENVGVKPYKFTDATLHKTDLVATKELMNQ
jgi:3D (Asp-Asp-Asp) domain-containing protein|tara:strand:+ start:467 stop:1000 length:534 start_codon:yes stop_codon:yes gene_type:complete